jgi:para-nitrobenzyl esterase
LGGLPIVDKPTANALGAAMGGELCAGESDVMACLRAKPVSDLITWRANAGISGAGWAPVYNPSDPFLPTKPVNLIATGNYNHGPIILGTNKNEWGLFQLAGLSPTITSVAQLQAAVSAQFGPLTPLVLQRYPASSDAVANGVFIQLMTDAVFRCPTRGLARLASARGSEVHLYSFEEGYAFHAMEIPYVFGNPSALLAPVLVESLRDTVQSYWTTFANTGNPNTSDQPNWPEYATASDQHMILKAASQTGSGLAQAQCDFWDYVATLQ